MSLDDVIAQLLKQQDVILHLQAEMAAKDRTTRTLEQEVQALQQRPYTERCESGELGTPDNAFIYGSGTRYRELTATFSRAFTTTPVVTVGFTELDNELDRNLRVSASVTSVYATHVIVQIGTWGNTRLDSARIRWMACA
eukprot:XP_002612857.1 hypothetical protein BRAFLDRAFT_67193 [Branchiostoma floridae]